MKIKTAIILLLILLISSCNYQKNEDSEIKTGDFKILKLTAKDTSDNLIDNKKDEIIYTVSLNSKDYNINFEDLKIELSAKDQKQLIIFDLFATKNYYYLKYIGKGPNFQEGILSYNDIVEIHFVPQVELTENDIIKLNIYYRDTLINSKTLRIPLLIEEETSLE